MPPKNADADVDEDERSNEHETPTITAEQKRLPLQIVWRNVIFYIVLHCMALYGLLLIPRAHPYTWIWTGVLYVTNGLGITAGVHRLWTHRSYRARLPLRILLAVFNSCAFQSYIIEWARDHRVHHKYSETDADPYNAKRGFFFAHVGWLLVRKHPDVREKGKLIDISDLYADPVCVIQKKFYLLSVLLFCFVIPTFVPWYFWGESARTSYFICTVLRYVLVQNATWTVNSVAHLWGNKPYDRNINPVENVFVAFGAIGEGYHNYHHVFPNDYSTSEYGWRLNPTTMFIDFMAKIGWAYDLHKTSAESVFNRRKRTGDGSSGFGY